MASPSVASDSLQPYGLYPTRLLCPREFPGKKTGVGYFLLQRNLPNPVIESLFPALSGEFFTTEPSGKTISLFDWIILHCMDILCVFHCMDTLCVDFLLLVNGQLGWFHCSATANSIDITTHLHVIVWTHVFNSLGICLL